MKMMVSTIQSNPNNIIYTFRTQKELRENSGGQDVVIVDDMGPSKAVEQQHETSSDAAILLPLVVTTIGEWTIYYVHVNHKRVIKTCLYPVLSVNMQV